MYQNKRLSRKLGKDAVVLILFGLIVFQTGIFFASYSMQIAPDQSDPIIKKESGVSPTSAAFREDQTIYSKQLINDSDFALPASSSPWTSSRSGDLSDIDPKIESSQSKSTMVGDNQTISIIADFSKPSEWTAMKNPAFPAYPEWPFNSGLNSYWMNASGFYTNHSWGEGSRQAPSINWARNVSLPVNISDYTITSASVRSVVNASVVATSAGSVGLEVATSECSPITQYVTGDYAKFYVRVADLYRLNLHEIAYNRTSPDLGLDATGTTLQGNTNMTSVNENLLKTYLASALSQDYQNFTIILGVDFWCEDNRPTDNDTWNVMCINTFNLTLTLEKTINYNSYLTWNETGYMINETDYLGSGDLINVDLLNATLNFNYRLTSNWPGTSPNSEIRVYINNYLHTETIKLSNGTTSFQEVKAGLGFDVSSLITLNQNVTIRIQIIMLDTFLLAQNCSLLIDNVNITTFFLATVQTTIPSTQLQLVGSTNIAAVWNETFSVTANYTRVDTGAGIAGANITIGWIDTYDVTDASGGLYTIQCNTSVTGANQHYNLQILAEAYGNESKSYTADIQIIERPTRLDLFLNMANSTTLPEVTVTWNQTVNITAFYYDTTSTNALLDATVDLSGTDFNPGSIISYNEIGTAYQYLINSSYFEVGPHFISLLGSKGNHSLASIIITLKITTRPTFLSIMRNTVNVTQASELNVPITGSITLGINYYDTGLGEALNNYEVSLQGLTSVITPGITTSVVINTVGLDLGVYIVSVVVGKNNYTQLSHPYQININQIQTNITTLDAKTTYTVVPNGDLEITLVVTDTDFNQNITGCELSYTWRFGSGVLTETSTPGVYKTVIKGIPEGENSLYITAYKGPSYRFEMKTITIVAVQSGGGGIDEWVVYTLIGAMIAISVLFIQYQLVWKYPPHIRKLRRLSRELKSGKLEKKGTALTFRTADVSFADNYLDSTKQVLTETGQNQLKNKYLVKKSVQTGKREVYEPLTRSPKTQEFPTQKPQTNPPNLPPESLPSPSRPIQEPAPVAPPEPQKTASLPDKLQPKPPPTRISPPIAPIPERFLGLIKQAPQPTVKPPLQAKELPTVKPLPQVKELPPKPATKPAPKSEEKPEEAAGEEKKE